MQDTPSTGQPDPKLYGPDGSELPSGGATDGEWAEVGRNIERLLRRDVARLVGTEDGAEWGAIKDALVGKVRGQAEAVDRTEITRRIEEIGHTVEEQLRCGMTQATGAGRDADWATIARTVRERVEGVLDPNKRPFPGGSGTASDSQDVDVPAAKPSPDREPTPFEAGGEDTGAPTVTNDVDAVPGRSTTRG